MSSAQQQPQTSHYPLGHTDATCRRCTHTLRATSSTLTYAKMNYCIVLSLGLVLISCSPLLANGREAGEQSLVSQLCPQVTETRKCMDYLRVADPKMLKAKDYHELAQVIIQDGEKKAIEGQKFLEGLAQVEKNPAIEKCANIYKNNVIGFFGGITFEMELKAPTSSLTARIGTDEVHSCTYQLENAKVNNTAIDALNSHINWYFLMAGSAIDNFM